MENIENEIRKLEEKLLAVSQKQYTLSNEIQEIKRELSLLKLSQKKETETAEQDQRTPQPITEKVKTPEEIVIEQAITPISQPKPKDKQPIKKTEKSNIEKFIGENLISKIGIIITVIGVAIGVKYSIDNQLISPLVRIVLGYLLGFGLLGFGIKLKEKYTNYSAVLVSGAMAIMYFITYSGYSFYSLIPQILAFILMLIFTVFTVIAAIHYNRQVIAHIGLVGAYAIPFLLSNNSGQTVVLFSYMAIINIGITYLACKKYWKPLYVSSFILTWLIYFAWYLFSYKTHNDFRLAFTFLCVFFFIFYIIFLIYKLIQKEKYKPFDIIPLLFNSFIFYGIGYSILDNHPTGNQLLGLFTLANAIIHFISGVIIHKQKLADKNLLYLIILLVFAFITIAIPVQLDGNWITLLWSAEACLLFAFGRIKNIPIYEKISYPLILLAFVSLAMDWRTMLDYPVLSPFFNIQFLTSILFTGVLACINYVHFRFKNPIKDLQQILNYCLPVILLVALYLSVFFEIDNYFSISFQKSMIEINTEGFAEQYFNYHIKEFESIWKINYTLLFVSILMLVNIFKIKNKTLGIASILLSILILLVFLFQGLYSLSELRAFYLDSSDSLWKANSWYIAIRYVSLIFAGFTIFSLYKQSKQSYMPDFRITFDFVFYGSLLWIISSELIHWLDMAGFQQTYKLGLSILWGVYALMLIAIGIWKKKKHLRISGIVVFGVTLIKLFFYDLSDLDTIAKTIVLVILGILLLIVSFLYNKYKHLIYNDEENKK